MLLKNFTNLIYAFKCGGDSSKGFQPNFKYNDGTSGDATARYNVSNPTISVMPGADGTGYTTNNQFAVYLLSGSTATCNNQFRCVTLLVGTGTTPVTFDDYALTRETTLTTVGVQNPTVDKNGKFTISHTLQNNTSADITITELGLARAGDKANSYASTATSYILLTRDVLDNPVTIPVGESRIFSIVIDQWNFSTGYNQSATVLVPKTITQNGVYNPADDNADGYSSVNVNVSGGAPQNIPMEISNGMLERPQTSFSYTMPSSVTDIGEHAFQFSFVGSAIQEFGFSQNITSITSDYACSQMCSDCANLWNVDFSNIEQVNGTETFSMAFAGTGLQVLAPAIQSIYGTDIFNGVCSGCPDLEAFVFADLTTITGSQNFAGACDGCPSLLSVDFQSLTTISGGSANFTYAFSGCEALNEVLFDSLTTISGSYVFEQAFSGCISLTELNFPSLTTLTNTGGESTFNDMLVDCDGVTVHFPAALQSTIGNWQSVLDGFGGTNTTVLFDL